MMTIVAVLITDDSVVIQQSITDERFEYLYRRHRMAGRIPRPIGTYGYGYREAHRYSHDEFKIMIKKNENSVNDVKVVNLCTFVSDVEIFSWLKSLVNVTVLINNAVSNEELMTIIFANNQLLHATIMCSPATIDTLKKIGNNSINYVLVWHDNSDPCEFYKDFVLHFKLEHITLYSIEYANDSVCDRLTEFNSEVSDYNYGDNIKYTFVNNRVVQEFADINCAIEMPVVCLPDNDIEHNNDILPIAFEHYDEYFEGSWNKDEYYSY